MSSKENDPGRILPKTLFQEGMQADAQGSFHGLFPMRQLFVPAMQFPLWNKNWDGLAMEPTGDEEEDRRSLRRLRKTGVTRHIILIRHGQYDESSRDDAKRILTPLGREQAHLTGKRIAEMMKGAPEQFGGPCRIKALRVSGLARAIETANIIAEYLPGIQVEEHDPMLNEGRYVNAVAQRFPSIERHWCLYCRQHLLVKATCLVAPKDCLTMRFSFLLCVAVALHTTTHQTVPHNSWWSVESQDCRNSRRTPPAHRIRLPHILLPGTRTTQRRRRRRGEQRRKARI